MGCVGGKGENAKGGAPGLSYPAGVGQGAGDGNRLLDHYTLGKVLGQGAFGIVYSCTKKQGKEEFAVKMIDKVETPITEIKQEAEMLRKLACPTIVKLHDVFYEKAFVCMVMDIYRGGDMIEGMQLHWKNLGMLPISVVANIVKQMVESIAFLHKRLVVHRDVKGDNFLMDRKQIENPGCRIFLSDFGTVRQLKEGERLNSKCGTKTYWAPEFFNMNYGLKVDVWAIGIVMYGLVTGRFPFKGEDDVKNKRIVIPPRSTKHCADLLKRFIERKEPDRIAAEDALEHSFLVNVGDSAGGEVEKMDFKPEIKEGGANAAIDERRKELVGRLEDQNAPRAAKPPTLALKDLRDKPSWEVVHKQAEKTNRFEWWSEAKAKQHNLLEVQGGSLLTDEEKKEDSTSGKDEIRHMLKDFNIDETQFGQGKYRSLEEFNEEVQTGASRLMLDATQHKKMVRVVDLVLLRIIYKGPTGKTYLIQCGETYSDGREKTTRNQMPGTKREPNESARQTAERVLHERMQCTDAKIKFDFTMSERFEDDEESSSYPGVRTVYRGQIFEGTITSTDPSVLERIGATKKGSYQVTDAKGYKRSFCWFTDKECADKNIKLKAPSAAGDTSALVHPPVGIGEEELKEFLEKNNVDVSQFGQGSNKSLKDFSDELVKGEAQLVRRDDGKVIRVVDVVIVKLRRGTEVLVQTEETFKGNKRTFNWLPAVKRRPDENMFLAAHRVLSKELKINENFVKFNAKEIIKSQEEKESAAYCNLPTLYRKRIISGELQLDAANCFL